MALYMVVDVTLHGNSCPKQHLHGEETAGPSTHGPIPGRDPSDYCTMLGRECLEAGQAPVGLCPAMVAEGSMCL